MSKFQVGDTVKLMGGGQVGGVVRQTGIVNVVWYDGLVCNIHETELEPAPQEHTWGGVTFVEAGPARPTQPGEWAYPLR